MLYHLAQVNIARMLAPLTDPLMAGFVAELDAINALADDSPGFLWRLQTPEGNATDIRPYEDDLILVNLSLWASLADLTAFVYTSRHRQVLQQRQQWFERFDGPCRESPRKPLSFMRGMNGHSFFGAWERRRC